MHSPVDWVLHQFVERTKRQAHTFVSTDPHAVRRMFINIACRFALVAVVSLANSYRLNLHDWTTSVIVVAWGSMAASFALSPMIRAFSYRVGWWDGRQQIRDSLRESELRGISREQWLLSEYARDMNMR